MKSNFRVVFGLALASMIAIAGVVCGPDPQKKNVPTWWMEDGGSYQASVEAITADGRVQIDENYDANNNILLSTVSFDQSVMRGYVYYQTNEFVFIDETSSCLVAETVKDFVDYASYPSVKINTTQHSLFPLTALFKDPHINFVYVGNMTVRGMAADQWKANFYSRYDSKTYDITVTFSDQNNWLSADMDRLMEAVPLELVVTSKKYNEDKGTTAYYTVTQFKPFLQLKDDDYSHPTNIYCRDRQNRKELPALKDQFSFNLQTVESFAGNLENGESGTISAYHEEYNFKHKLFMMTKNLGKGIINEIHDFNTGLKYDLDVTTANCTVSKLKLDDGPDSVVNGSMLRVRNPTEFFSFNEDYKYIGVKQRDGVLTEAWIGPKNFNGFDGYFVWYFLAETWKRNDSSPGAVPIQLDALIKTDTGNKLISIMHIFDYTRTKYQLNDFDLANCNADIKRTFFIFNLRKVRSILQPISENKAAFQQAVLEMLMKKAKVTILRISQIEIVIQNGAVYVMFALNERVKSYGSVDIPAEDYSLEDASNNLMEAFKTDINIEFHKLNGQKKIVYKVAVGKNSLKAVPDYREGYVTLPHVTYGFSGGFIVGTIFLILALGFAIGVGLYILESQYLHLIKK